MKRKSFFNAKFIASIIAIIALIQLPSAKAFDDYYGYENFSSDLIDTIENLAVSLDDEDEDDVQGKKVAIIDQQKEVQENFTSDVEAEDYNENVKPKFELSAAVENVTSTDKWPSQLSIFKKEGLEFDKGPIKSIKLGVMYNGTWTEQFPKSTSKYTNDLLIPSIEFRFRDDKTLFNMSYNFFSKSDDGKRKFFSQINEVYVMHKFNKNNRVIIGQGPRLPIGVEGSAGAFGYDLPTRAYIGRTFGNTRSIGIRYQGNFKYADLDLAVTDGRRYMRSYGGGGEFVGWVNFKPLAALDSNKWGKLTLGTGIDVGKSGNDYCVWGGYVGYDWRRFHNKFEYAYGDGYNGGTGLASTKKTHGFYDTVILDITDKWSLLGRIDWYDTDIQSKKDTINIDYTAGLTYKISKNMRLLFAYTYKNKPGNNSEVHAHQLQLQVRVNI
ncbi:hypothetical protein IJG72_03905 [bacterium]|nr:hypothetical protein [bacterium]